MITRFGRQLQEHGHRSGYRSGINSHNNPDTILTQVIADVSVMPAQVGDVTEQPMLSLETIIGFMAAATLLSWIRGHFMSRLS